MYMIAQGGIEILRYAYPKMDDHFEVVIRFSDFQAETGFQFGIDEFKKSMNYLTERKMIKLAESEYDTSFTFKMALEWLPRIEEILFEQQY